MILRTTEQIAVRLAEYCRHEQFSEAQSELYADEAVSIEFSIHQGLTWKRGPCLP